MINSGPFALALGTPVTIPNPLNSGGTPPDRVQLCNTSGLLVQARTGCSPHTRG